jgi:hypothetical protein
MNDNQPAPGAAAADVSPRTAEIRRTHRVLIQLLKIAEHGTMTGALGRSGPDATVQFNLIREHLRTLGVEPGPLFPPLPEDASLDRVGVASRLLAAYIEDETREKERTPGPPPPPADLFARQFEGPEGLERLRQLGQALRDNLPEFFTQQGAATGRGQGTQEAAEQPGSIAAGLELMPPIPPPTDAADPVTEPTMPRRA